MLGAATDHACFFHRVAPLERTSVASLVSSSSRQLGYGCKSRNFAGLYSLSRVRARFMGPPEDLNSVSRFIWCAVASFAVNLGLRRRRTLRSGRNCAPRLRTKSSFVMEASDARLTVDDGSGLLQKTEATDEDAYPSRLPLIPGESIPLQPRAHPVVWREPVAHGETWQEPLTAELVAEYRRRGFVVLKGALRAAEFASLIAESLSEIEALQASVYAAGADLKLSESGVRDAGFEDDHIITEVSSSDIRSVFAVHQGGPSASPRPAMAALCRATPIVQAARQLLGSDVYITQSRANLQAAFRGRGFTWHSDFETWHAEDGMPLPRCLSAVIPLEPCVPENGALMLMPGTHQFFAPCAGLTPAANFESSLKAQQLYGTPDCAQLAALAQIGFETGAGRSGIEYATCEPGDVILFDCNLMHGSQANMSPLSRRSLFCVYNSVHNKLGAPYDSSARAHGVRPEYIAARDPSSEHPI